MRLNKKSFVEAALSGSIWNLVWAIIQRAGGLIFTIILARVLLPEGFGLYNLVISVAAIVTIISDKGINEILIRYLSEKFKEKKQKNYFAFILKIKLFLLVTLCLILIFVAYPVAMFAFNKPIMFIPLVIASAYTFLFSLENFLAGTFFVLKKVNLIAAKESIYQISRLIIIILVSLSVSHEYILSMVFVSLSLASLITLIFVLLKLKKYPLYSTNPHLPLSVLEKKRVLSLAGYLTLTAISYVLLGNLDSILLGLFLQAPSYIGFYKAAFALTSSLAGLFGFGQVLLPLFIQTKEKDLEKSFNKVFRYVMLIVIPSAAGLAVLGKYFLLAVYGSEYLEAYSSLIILSLFTIFSVQVSLFVYLFILKEKPKEYLVALISSILINLISNLILLSVLSKYSGNLAIIGASISAVFSWGVYSIWLSKISKNKLNIKIDFKVVIKPLISAIIMCIILLEILRFIKNINIVLGIILVILGAAIYFCALLLLKGINKEDKIIISVLSRKVPIFFSINHT